MIMRAARKREPKVHPRIFLALAFDALAGSPGQIEVLSFARHGDKAVGLDEPRGDSISRHPSQSIVTTASMLPTLRRQHKTNHNFISAKVVLGGVDKFPIMLTPRWRRWRSCKGGGAHTFAPAQVAALDSAPA